MSELTMEQKLEEARKVSGYGCFRVYAYSNGNDIKLKLDRVEKEGYWLCAIFEDGHPVEA